MTQTQLFSSGLELANFVVSLDVLHDAWTAIWSLYTEISQNERPSSLVKFKVFELPNCTIIAFFTWPANSKDYVQGNGGGDFVSSSTLKKSFPFFNFLCTKDNPEFSINKPALELFTSIFYELPKSVMANSKPLIITGNSLGGSVASLFTLLLLEKFNFLTTKRPLCITFGSPLMGEKGLHEAISKYAAWNSCFLHVVSNQDPIPRVLISQTGVYKPFGTFLLCSKLGCSCFEDPPTILELLMATYSGNPENQDPNLVFESYGTFVKDFNRKVIFMDTTESFDWTTPPLRAAIITQLAAIGLASQQQPHNIDIDTIITKTENQEKKLALFKKQVFDPSMQLNKVKVHMAKLEWYKKVAKDKKIGYYDSYKNVSHTSDLDVVKDMKTLTCYWEELVDEAEKRPQTVGASLRTRWLFGGTNYRRMIEPLDIADYYNKGKEDYINQGRPKHYIKLEQWLIETAEPAGVPNELMKQNVVSILTEDSCFWAHVEEALISCKLLTGTGSSEMEKQSSRDSLFEFENYVYGLIKNYAVSPEIFLQGSSFMQWWREYEKIMGTSYSSNLTKLMKDYKNYDKYATGSLKIS
ncbi:senescence-associated carboxylesterase 101-like isoform X2 [Quercus lobata]|uniref:senescence-associated carboxylesterase 101-like isoform X2 n=1 Tax=Quercus lobata TaxID=97700 RepID=UPI0012445474|nr:senescence-associated carboxylesterase 101-like isoform X2 [Quercus lobata]